MNLINVDFSNKQGEIKKIINNLNETELKEMIVLSITVEGEYLVHGSTNDKERICYLLTRTLHKLMNGDYDGD